MLPVTQSPLAKLFAKIKAEMVANGTPFADAAAEIAFRTWFDSAWIDSGCTQEFVVLYQPATSTTVSMAVRGPTGHKSNVWWSDGSIDSYTLTSDANTAVSKTYAVGALRPIVVLGKLTQVEGGGQAFGGRLWAHLPSLTYLDCGGYPLLTGDIATLSPSLTYLSCWGCPLLTGDIATLSPSLTYLDCGGCPFTYSTVSGTRAWAAGVRGVWVSVPTVGLWTSAMTDALLIDLSGTTFSGEKYVRATGNCGAPTAAADAAIDSLISQGVSVDTN